MSTTTQQLTFGHRIGVFILAEISAVSASSVIILLSYIAVCFLNLVRQGGLMNLKWVVDGSVHTGSFCTVQGLIKQLADVGTALSAGSVAIYTFSTIIFRLKPDTNVSRAAFIVAAIWISITLNVAINVGINGASRFYGPTGAWCWITEEFHVQRTVADFLWMWISAFSSLLAYVAVFLVLGGFIRAEGWHIRWIYGREFRDVLPLAAARYNDFTRNDTPFGVVVLADGFYLLSGLLNVILYAYTRPYLLPRNKDSGDDQSFALHDPVSKLPVQKDIGPKLADLPYAVQEMAHRQDATHPENEPRDSIYEEI
ncbi:hypothetical protein BJV78DRAFT_1150341 [Lactifluus subvellereus]|nr:hypothetical protein BJV78DRAFT_1150341 [Lactifluus subvellereus]